MFREYVGYCQIEIIWDYKDSATGLYYTFSEDIKTRAEQGTRAKTESYMVT